MNALTRRLQLMVNYVTLFVSIDLQAKIWKNLRRLLKNLELNLEFIFNKDPYLTVIIGDFNAKSHNWYKGDKTTTSGSALKTSSHYGLTQINEPTHIEDSSSCIDLVFTSQPNRF